MQSTTAVFLWKKGRLNDIAEITMGQSPDGSSYNFHGEGIGLINGPTEFTNKYPVVRQWTTKPTKLCRPGDILLCVRGSSTGRMNLSDAEYCIGRGVASISAKEGKGVTGFLYYLLDYKISQLLKKTAGSTFPNLSSDEIRNMEISIPSLEEQNKIADILSTWDKAIELKEKLIEQKKEQKKGLMQRLLTGKVRLPGFDGKWIKLKIKDLIKEVNDRTTQNNQYEVLSVTKNGIVPQREQFNKQIASEDNTGYKIVRRNNLVFSTMNLWMGSLDVLTTHDVGIVSPAYKVFEFIEQNINPLFGKYFMLSDYMIRIYKMNSEQGASIVRRNLDMDGLLNTIVSVPPVEEQREIFKVLQSADDELTLLCSELEALKQQKRGLMQLLLTGKVRVKC